MQWNITRMDAYPEYEGQQNVVSTVSWIITKTESGYKGTLMGATDVSPHVGENFIPYNQLTEEQVVLWVKTALGESAVAAYEASVQQQINNQITPVIVTPELPWN